MFNSTRWRGKSHHFFNKTTILIDFFLFQDNGPDWPARIKHLMKLAPLSYSLVIMMKDKIYGVRDSYGNRPLSIGKIVPIDLKGSEYTIYIHNCYFIKN